MRPITAQPGHTASEVEDAMDSGQYVFADCFTISPISGFPMRYTTASRRVSLVPIGEITHQAFEADKVLIKGLLTKCSIGFEVDEQEVQMDYADDNTLFQNYLSWPKALIDGRLDGGTITRDRYIAKDWGGPSGPDWLGGFPMFSGLVSSMEKVGRQSATIKVKSDLVKLNVQMPRDLWESNCKNTWGDTLCGVNQLDYAVSGTVGVSPTRSVLPWASASSEYALGKIHIENGDSTTRVRTISRVSGGNLYLSYPLDFDPFEGMTFTAFPGCNRTKERCPTFHPTDWEKFFKGFPFVPVAETSIGG